MADESTVPESEHGAPVRSDELIDEAGKESFPASDPPATWSGVDHRDVDHRDVGVEAGATPDGRVSGSD